MDFKPAQLDIEDLSKVARFSHDEVDTRIPQHMKGGAVLIDGVETRVADKAWETTICRRPIRAGSGKNEVDGLVGELWTPSRRFGIVQSGKVRNMDDLSEFSVNMTYGTPEKLDLGGVDEVVSLASQWRKIADLQGKEAVVHGENGTGFRGPLHQHYMDENNLKLVGRCLDLKSAYISRLL